MAKRTAGNSPFIVGVLGHREMYPADLQALRASVTSFIGDLAQHLPNTELAFLVGIRGGADLLIAQAALALGVRVEALLSRPPADHTEHFDADALATLERLCAQPDFKSTVLRPPAAADDAGSIDAEEEMEANLADTVIRRSSLLLALWDGRPAAHAGSTAHTVLRYLGVHAEGGASDSLVIFDEAEELDAADRLVYWTPAGEGCEERQPMFLRSVGDNRILKQRHMPRELAHKLRELNDYNREYEQLLAQRRIGRTDSLLSSLPEDAPVDAHMMLGDIDAQYGKADALAIYYQARSDRLFKFFGLMAFAMGLAYLVYEKVTQSSMLLFIYLLVLLSSVSIYYALRGRRWFGKHLTYRALAETMRAQFYLRLAGLDHRVDSARVLALSGIDRFEGFSLINYVLAGVAAPDLNEVEIDDADLERSRCIERSWIDSQHRYFIRKVAHLERGSARVNLLKRAVFVVILLVILAMFLFDRLMSEYTLWFGVSLKNMLTFWMGFLALLLGVWQLHEDKMANRELLWQYRNQRTLFAKARRQLARLTVVSRRNEVLIELGRNSLMESYLWTIHRYHREHEPPGKG